MSKAIDLYLITALSNLHVGRGDSNYGIVDNEIQRDPITDYPTVYASSIKGALREAMQSDMDKRDRLYVFGSEVGSTRTDSKGKPEPLQQGHYIFHQAHLLSMPVRGEIHPFYHATAPQLFKDLQEQLNIFGVEYDDAVARLAAMSITHGPLAPGNHRLDEYEGTAFGDAENKTMDGLAGLGLLRRPAAVFSNEQFGGVCERLPVIARNQLDKGISKNLFYEEIVPRLSRFYCFIERPDGDTKLEDSLRKRHHRVQLGANATIGYGVCTFERITLTDSTKA